MMRSGWPNGRPAGEYRSNTRGQRSQFPPFRDLPQNPQGDDGEAGGKKNLAHPDGNAIGKDFSSLTLGQNKLKRRHRQERSHRPCKPPCPASPTAPPPSPEQPFSHRRKKQH